MANYLHQRGTGLIDGVVECPVSMLLSTNHLLLLLDLRLIGPALQSELLPVDLSRVAVGELL